jgi:hypothetical protein
MKKTLTGVVALLAGAFVAHSQGLGTVTMGNYFAQSPGSYIYVSYNGTKLGGTTTGAPTGTPTANVGKGDDWTVALYGNAGSGDAASTLTECTVSGSPGTFATATFADGTTDKKLGTWYSGTIAAIPGTTGGGQAATLQLYAWYNNGGTVTSYAASVAANGVNGKSALENLASTGGPETGLPPALPGNIPAFPAFIVSGVPEPSTIALGVMGASGMLLRLRRKK